MIRPPLPHAALKNCAWTVAYGLGKRLPQTPLYKYAPLLQTCPITWLALHMSGLLSPLRPSPEGLSSTGICHCRPWPCWSLPTSHPANLTLPGSSTSTNSDHGLHLLGDPQSRCGLLVPKNFRDGIISLTLRRRKQTEGWAHPDSHAAGNHEGWDLNSGLMTPLFVSYYYSLKLPRWLSSKESACCAGDAGLIPLSGRSPGEGNGNPLQYSCLQNSMDRGA